MAISGSLEDVAVADVLQFIHLGKRTGTLELEREGEHARFGFHDGSLVAAHAPGAPLLGELLVEGGHVDRSALADAMARQKAGGGRRSLGQLLIESGQLEAPVLQQVVRRQLEGAVERVLSWERGSFDFALDEIRPVDDIGMETSDFVHEEGLGANVVLLEAARIFDERDRRGTPPTLAEATEQAIDGLLEEESEPSTVAGPEIRALTPDREFVRKLRETLGERASIRRVALGRATEAPAPEGTDILLLDVREDALDPEALAVIRNERPEARLVVIVDSTSAMQVAFRHGAVAAVPAEVETVGSCLVNLLESSGARSIEAPALGDSGVRRLQRALGELRSGLASATVALNLMQLVSESFERALLLLIKRDRLTTLGAFGNAADGQPLAVAVRRLELAPSGLLLAALTSSQVRTGRFADADLPGGLSAVLGAPRNDEVVVFPVAGTERVIAVVYADNGDSAQPLRDVDLLEVAAAQVGIAFENELLRRQLGRSAG